VKMVVEQDRSVNAVADGLGVHPSLIQRWKSQLQSEGRVAVPGNGSPANDDELRRLRRELSIAQQERDILKKALATSRKKRTEVSVRPRPPGDVRGGPDVQDPGGLPEWILCLARSR
jgi:transposase